MDDTFEKYEYFQPGSSLTTLKENVLELCNEQQQD